MSNRTSKITYIALNPAVVLALTAGGYDSDKVLASVNCAIGRAQLDTTKTKAGEAKFSTKTDFASIKETETATFVSKEIGLTFLAFHDAEVKMQKTFGAREVTIPRQFIPWLEKHKKGSPAQESTAQAVKASEVGEPDLGELSKAQELAAK